MQTFLLVFSIISIVVYIVIAIVEKIMHMKNNKEDN